MVRSMCRRPFIIAALVSNHPSSASRRSLSYRSTRAKRARRDWGPVRLGGTGRGKRFRRSIDPVALSLAPERRDADAEACGRLLEGGRLREDLLDAHALQVLERSAVFRTRDGGRLRGCEHGVGQALGLDEVAAR